jgi:hypothetical protein
VDEKGEATMKTLTGLLMGLLAADISGAWTLRYDKDFSGHPATHECTFQQQGEKLTATCDGGGKFAGSVKDGKVALEAKTGKNNEIVVRYTAVVNQEASFMKGVWQYVDPSDKTEKSGRFAFEKH